MSSTKSPTGVTKAAPMPLLYRTCWHVARGISRVYFRWDVRHADRVPPSGPVILAANHVSFADPPIIGCAIHRTVHFLARDTLFDVTGLGWFIKKLNAVPVDREGGGGAGLKAILDRLQRGGAIILFPEGTRSPDGQIRKAKAGIGLTVIKSAAPVVPVRVIGMFECWGRHQRLPRPGRVTIAFGQPIDFSALRAEAEHCDKARLKGIYQDVSDRIMRVIGDLGSDV